MNGVLLVAALALCIDDVTIRGLWDSFAPETREAFGRVHIECEAKPSAEAPASPGNAGLVEFARACRLLETTPGPFSWKVEGDSSRRLWTARCPDSRMTPALAPKEWVVIDGPVKPQRFDVIAVRASDGSMSFARVLGLPGERIDIMHGDLYVNKRIVRKPADLQAHAWLELEALTSAPARWKWPAGIALGADGSIRVAADAGKKGLEIVRLDAGRLQRSPEPILCGDLRLEMTARAEASGQATIEIDDGPFVARAEVGADSFTLRVLEYDEDDDLYRDVRTEKGSIAAATGASWRLALENADDAVVLERDGRRLARIEFDSDTEGGSSVVKIGGDQGVVVLRDVMIRRDLHWKHGDRHDYPVSVAPGQLFVAADAFDASGDSRFVAGAAGVSDDAVTGRVILAVNASNALRRVY